MPCQHGGTCVDLINGYECRCTDQYTGVNCDRSKYPLSLICRFLRFSRHRRQLRAAGEDRDIASAPDTTTNRVPLRSSLRQVGPAIYFLFIQADDFTAGLDFEGDD